MGTESEKGRELVQKISQLEAYVKVLQEDAKCLDEYKSYVTTLRTEMDGLKKEVSKLWDIIDGLREFKTRTESDVAGLEEGNDRVFTKLRTLTHKIDKINEDYPEMRQVFRAIKKQLIAVIASAVILSVFISVGIYFYFSSR